MRLASTGPVMPPQPHGGTAIWRTETQSHYTVPYMRYVLFPSYWHYVTVICPVLECLPRLNYTGSLLGLHAEMGFIIIGLTFSLW